MRTGRTWAHVLYERGDEVDGAAFVHGRRPGNPREAHLHCHLSWHLALFQPRAAGSIARRRPISEHPAGRGAVAGDAGAGRLRITAVARRAAGSEHRADHFGGRHVRRELVPEHRDGFGDAHCAVADAAAGERESLERWIAELRIADDEGWLASGSALPMVAEALGAFACGDYDEAIRLLEPAVDRFVRIGGSRAQRDLFEITLLAAYWRSGRGAAAAGLLERRLDRRPTVPGPRGA